MPTAHCLLPTVCCPLSTVCCQLSTANCQLPTAYCLLPTVYCLLSHHPLERIPDPQVEIEPRAISHIVPQGGLLRDVPVFRLEQPTLPDR